MLADEMIQQSNAILQALPTDIMYIVIDRLSLEIETGMVIFPHTSNLDVGTDNDAVIHIRHTTRDPLRLDEEDEDERDMGSESEDDEFDNSEDVEPTTESAVAWLSGLPKDQKIVGEAARPEGLLHLGLKCPGPGRVVDGLVLAEAVALLAVTKDVLLGVLGVIVIVIAQDFLDKVKEVIEAAKEVVTATGELVLYFLRRLPLRRTSNGTREEYPITPRTTSDHEWS
ncbi:hypothetical protein PENPOL_c001G09490 [Penicillium polonicum]|uniref:Uncharacterized protein n=1 Tax=Penicillium polonicum TaxID=60169 RepID=A0A1V6P4M3_PENPO|nr:hypothetical protein PENPOL_c001G09490 [Penicillium polonicum]